MKKWASRLSKIAFVIFAFFAILVTIMVNMGGDSETLKRAVEDYISQSTGYAAQIETLNEMTFYPYISIEAENIRMVSVDVEALKAWAEAEKQKPEEERGKTPAPRINYADPVGTIEKLIVSMGFWDVTFGVGRKVRNIYVQNASFKAGSLSYKPVKIEAIEIDETPEGKPFLTAKGNFGSDEFHANVDLQGVGSKKRRKYKIGEESEFQAEIGKLSIQGVLRPRTMGGFHARDVIVANDGDTAVEATISFVRGGDKMIDLKGAFSLPENGSNAEIDWEIGSKETAEITGKMDASLIDTADFASTSKLSQTLKIWDETFKAPQTEQGDNNIQITINAETFKSGPQEISPYKGTLTIDNNQFNFKATP